MVSLRDVLSGVSYFSNKPLDQIEEIRIENVCYNSKYAKDGSVFVCIVGETVDGHRYAKGAYDNGCRVFVVTKDIELPDDAVQLKVDNSRIALAVISENFFDNPSKRLKIIGVTGTKGKTTISNLIAKVLNEVGVNTGCIGTNGSWYNDVHIKTKNTTPESYELAYTFDQMLKAGVECVVMEVSSQGVMMHRTHGIDFYMGVFTNLSPDHIGPKEHKDFDDYLSCKARLFSQCGVGLINIDDQYAKDIIKNATCEVKTFGIEDRSADFVGTNIQKYMDKNTLGVEFSLKSHGREEKVILSTPGAFSVYNGLAIIGVCDQLGIPMEDSIKALTDQVVEGRMEIVKGLDYCTFIIDFAHNELSFESLFSTICEYKKGRLIALFGSVGGRTELRRPKLGAIAGRYCDMCILTADNPDFEDPREIINGIVEGIDNQCPFVAFSDREAAVRYAVSSAQKDDIILFCGKGHEDYQLINGVKEPFSEKAIILDECAKVRQRVTV